MVSKTEQFKPVVKAQHTYKKHNKNDERSTWTVDWAAVAAAARANVGWATGGRGWPAAAHLFAFLDRKNFQQGQKKPPQTHQLE